ncbi:MAG TPA: bifunctional folylpolyglutamate synthase/dihydrofolate synthase, partial [Arenibaculum sp.]|nr:bifunctional folylpolyglutamate synthase/dihydrofolate synthase [Arenibaculum sp.]
EPITFFEVTTCAAFLAFRRTPADVLLLETGLGGRLDATTVIDRPAVTAITRVSYDHMQFLGGTLAGIAGEKAGILKPGVPVVVAPQPAEADDAITGRAAEVGAPLRAFGSAWRVEPLKDGFRFESGARRLDLPRPGLAGAHQTINAGTAIACLDHLPVLDETAIRRGLAEVDWPGRLQRLRRGPLVDRLPDGWELWLDGGHNDSAGEVLAAQAAAWRAESGKPLFLVFGMLSTKRPQDFLEPLAPYVQCLRAVAVPGEEAGLPAHEAAAAARKAGIADSGPAPDVRAAVGQLLEATAPAGGRPGRILICGSLYLAGAILSRHG